MTPGTITSEPKPPVPTAPPSFEPPRATNVDAGVASLDAGSWGAGAPERSPDASTSAPGANGDAGIEAGCPALIAPDAGVCNAYDCRVSLDQLRASATQGACFAPEAVAAACYGTTSNAALRCTEESVFAADLAGAVSMCMKSEPSFNALGAACIDCFVDEALCTLSRCFVACALASENSACQSCRHQQCGAALAQCTGLPAP